MKNALVGFKDRFQQAEETVNMKVGQLKLCSLRNRKKKKKNNGEKWIGMKRPVDTIKCIQIFIERLKKIETQTIFQKVMAINIQNLIKDITIKETQQTPSRINAKRSRLSKSH